MTHLLTWALLCFAARLLGPVGPGLRPLMPALADSGPHRTAVAITLAATLLTSVAYAPDPAHDATHEEGVVYVHTVVDHGDGPVTTCEGRRPEEPPRLTLAEAD